MREVISLNGELSLLRVRDLLFVNLFASFGRFADPHVRLVGQAGCQIANSCWEVRF